MDFSQKASKSVSVATIEAAVRDKKLAASSVFSYLGIVPSGRRSKRIPG